MKLLIVEDEHILADKYARYLGDLFDQIELVHNYSDAHKMITDQDFHVYLVDYNLPDGNGLELVKLLSQKEVMPVTLLITAYSKERIAIDSLNLGVFRYLEKPVDKEELKSQMALGLQKAKENASLHNLATHFSLSTKAQSILSEEYFISPRELEVLVSVLIHGKNKPVASELNISDGTVRNHLSSIFQKLHVGTKEELKEFVVKLNRS